MTESNSEVIQEIKPSKKISRRKFIAGVALGTGVLISGRKQVAEGLFGEEDDILLGSYLGDKFPREEEKFSRGTVSFRDLRPEVLREEVDVPLVSMVGLGMDQAVIGYVLESLHDQNQHVVALDIKGGEGFLGTINGTQELDRQGDLIGDFINKYLSENPGIKKVDLMGQSLSAISVLSFAKNHPELLSKVRNVLLVSPMGLSENDSLGAIKDRKFKEDKRNNERLKSEEDLQIEGRVAKAFARNVISSPIRTFEELLAMAKANNYPTIEELKSNGVRVGIIQGADDLLADADMLMERIGKDFQNTVVEVSDEKKDVGRPGQTHEYIPLNQEQVNQLEKTPSVRLVKGGHEIMGPSKFAGTILRTIDRLNNPITQEQALENIKKYQQ